MNIDPKDYKNILEAVIVKGGLMAACAKIYINEEFFGEQLIVELFEMCESEHFRAFLGSDLVNGIRLNRAIQVYSKA
jgi:hypothetical protein